MHPCGTTVRVTNQTHPRDLGIVVSIGRLNYGVRHADGEVIYYPHPLVTKALP